MHCTLVRIYPYYGPQRVKRVFHFVMASLTLYLLTIIPRQLQIRYFSPHSKNIFGYNQPIFTLLGILESSPRAAYNELKLDTTEITYPTPGCLKYSPSLGIRENSLLVSHFSLLHRKHFKFDVLGFFLCCPRAQNMHR